MDGIHGNNAGIHRPDGQHHPIHVQHYMQEHDHGMHHMSNGGSMDEDHDEGGSGEGMEGDVQADPGNLADSRGALTVQPGGSDNQNQLTLSFQGQVYVFDSVSPEKVIVFLPLFLSSVQYSFEFCYYFELQVLCMHKIYANSSWLMNNRFLCN